MPPKGDDDRLVLDYKHRGLWLFWNGRTIGDVSSGTAARNWIRTKIALRSSQNGER